jgi:hypothetical protein
MSGTRIRTCILHVCPEVPDWGGPLALVCDGDLFASIPGDAPSIFSSNRKSSSREGLLGVRQSRTYPWLRRTVLPARHPGGPGMRFRFSSVLSPKYEVFRCDQNGPPARRSEPDWRMEGAYLNSVASYALLLFLAIRMADILSLITPEGIFGDVCRIIADTLKSTSDEDEIQVTGHRF